MENTSSKADHRMAGGGRVQVNNPISISSSRNESSNGQGSDGEKRRAQRPEDFQFGRLVGEGSFSSVFLARDVVKHQEVQFSGLRHSVNYSSESSWYDLRIFAFMPLGGSVVSFAPFWSTLTGK